MPSRISSGVTSWTSRQPVSFDLSFTRGAAQFTYAHRLVPVQGPRGLVVALTDVTELRRAEAERAAALTTLQTVTQLVPGWPG
jgi:hypothetical protein